MLNTNAARLAMETINKGDGNHYGNIVNMEDTTRMEEIKVSASGGYSIYGLTKGDMTILVWFQNNTANVKFVCW